MSISNLSSQILNILPPVIRAIRAEMRVLAQPELTVAQFRILTRLSHSIHTNQELANWMGISAASMCRTIDVLVKRGYVLRRQDKLDRREVKLTLTINGKKKYSSIELLTKKMLKKKIAILSALEQDELLVALSHLERIFL